MYDYNKSYYCKQKKMKVSLGYCEQCFTFGHCPQSENLNRIETKDKTKKWYLSARRNLQERSEVLCIL